MTTKILSEQEFAVTKDGREVPDGVYKLFYTDGTLKSLMFYKMGKRDSIALSYYKNGHIETDRFFDKDKAWGPQLFYNEMGTLDSVSCYVGGLHFLSLYYNHQGRVRDVKGTLFQVIFKQKTDTIKAGTASGFLGNTKSIGCNRSAFYPYRDTWP